MRPRLDQRPPCHDRLVNWQLTAVFDGRQRVSLGGLDLFDAKRVESDYPLMSTRIGSKRSFDVKIAYANQFVDQDDRTSET